MARSLEKLPPDTNVMLSNCLFHYSMLYHFMNNKTSIYALNSKHKVRRGKKCMLGTRWLLLMTIFIIY